MTNSSSPRKSGFVFLEKGKKPVISLLEKCAFMRLLSNVVLGSPFIGPNFYIFHSKKNPTQTKTIGLTSTQQLTQDFNKILSPIITPPCANALGLYTSVPTVKLYLVWPWQCFLLECTA